MVHGVYENGGRGQDGLCPHFRTEIVLLKFAIPCIDHANFFVGENVCPYISSPRYVYATDSLCKTSKHLLGVKTDVQVTA